MVGLRWVGRVRDLYERVRDDKLCPGKRWVLLRLDGYAWRLLRRGHTLTG